MHKLSLQVQIKSYKKLDLYTVIYYLVQKNKIIIDLITLTS